MKPTMTRKGQVYSVGNYLMNGKLLGKGHFARVEEATHRIIGKKVAIKIIDLTCIKEEYARRNLHREPKVMARLRHPCIAALYETLMHGPRLYVVMEAAGGGDLCAHVLNARAGNGGARGLPEGRARALSAQLVSAVRHMHARGVVHRDLKMENIMLDGTKQFIKIVDFGLSNVWSATGGLRTPCGSLEYAAPELFLDNRRYGPEVDLWSVGVIVYGMVTGSLPFGGGGGAACEGGGRSRPQLRAAIARGFARKHRVALAHLSPECKIFVQQLLEPNVETRMKIEEAARHRWLRKPGMRLQTHPLPDLELKTSRTIVKQISELSGQSLTDVTAEIKMDPYGSIGGMYNIKTHLTQLQNAGSDVIWTSSPDTQPRPASPPVYHPHATTIFRQSPQIEHQDSPGHPSSAIYKYSPSLNSTARSQANSTYTAPPQQTTTSVIKQNVTLNSPVFKLLPTNKPPGNSSACRQLPSNSSYKQSSQNAPVYKPVQVCKQTSQPAIPSFRQILAPTDSYKSLPPSPAYNPQSPSSIRPGVKHRGPIIRPMSVRKPLYRVTDNGDGVESRLPSIDEHSKLDVDKGRGKTREEERLRLTSCPDRAEKRAEFYRRGGDGLPCWRATGVANTASARILLQSNATTIKRASLGNIVSPHSSSNSHCKSDRAAPVGWFSTRSTTKESTHLQRLRRTAPIK